jgi:excisionase family DNA binding protein
MPKTIKKAVTPLSADDALSKAEAAQVARVTERTIQRWVARGHLTRYVRQTNRLAVSRSELETFLTGRPVPHA